MGYRHPSGEVRLDRLKFDKPCCDGHRETHLAPAV
jgi:hypothetical protein